MKTTERKKLSRAKLENEIKKIESNPAQRRCAGYLVTQLQYAALSNQRQKQRTAVYAKKKLLALIEENGTIYTDETSVKMFARIYVRYIRYTTEDGTLVAFRRKGRSELGSMKNGFEVRQLTEKEGV